MSTITKEWLQQKIADMEATRDDIPFGLGEDGTNTLAALRIALASLEAEPVAYMHRSGQVVKREECCDDKTFAICCKVETPLYASQPAPVDNIHPLLEFAKEYIESWDLGMAGDSSLLASAKQAIADSSAHQPAPVSVPDDVLKGLLPDAEKAEFWFEHNGKILFEGVKFNNAVFDACRAAMLQGADGNSPVIPDGWALVPVEPTEEMLAELCLVKGWTARALNTRYQAMLAAAPKPEA
jgi:hypothetical protein